MAKIKLLAEEEKPLNGKPAEAADDGREEEQAPERLTREQAANRVIAELGGDETTVTELAEKADALFVAGGGGRSNTDRMYWVVYQALETAAALGVVALEEPDTLVRKVRK